MTVDAPQRLTKQESDAVWDRFDQVIHFHASTHEFPAITELADAIAWSLDTFPTATARRTLSA